MDFLVGFLFGYFIKKFIEWLWELSQDLDDYRRFTKHD